MKKLLLVDAVRVKQRVDRKKSWGGEVQDIKIPYIRCIALDFDWTLARFIGGYESLYDIFRRRNIDESIIQESCLAAEKEGFAIQTLTRIIHQATPDIPDIANIKPEFDSWLKTALQPYPETKSVLEQLAPLVPLAIVTRGNKEFQIRKIKAAGITCQEIHVVTPPDKKSDILSQLIQRYGGPIIFVDDRARELDSARDCLKEDVLITVRINRGDSPDDDGEPRYQHETIGSLTELITIFANSAA